jgi:hypothetical protein
MLKRKFQAGNPYIGTVGGTTLRATGRTKREAVVRLRRMFASAGLPTKPDALTDLLSVMQDAKVAPTVKAPKAKKPAKPRVKSAEDKPRAVKPRVRKEKVAA